jgi:hypothetical protein
MIYVDVSGAIFTLFRGVLFPICSRFVPSSGVGILKILSRTDWHRRWKDMQNDVCSRRGVKLRDGLAFTLYVMAIAVTIPFARKLGNALVEALKIESNTQGVVSRFSASNNRRGETAKSTQNKRCNPAA